MTNDDDAPLKFLRSPEPKTRHRGERAILRNTRKVVAPPPPIPTIGAPPHDLNLEERKIWRTRAAEYATLSPAERGTLEALCRVERRIAHHPSPLIQDLRLAQVYRNALAKAARDNVSRRKTTRSLPDDPYDD